MTYLCISDDIKLGKNVKISKFINLYSCAIGDNTKIGFCRNPEEHLRLKNCKISSHTLICEEVTVEDNITFMLSALKTVIL